MPMRTDEEQRSYQREWIRKRRDQWITENGPCAECGSCSNLEVDHIDPSMKQMKISSIWSRSDRLKELAKCQVLCGDCHKSKSSKESSSLNSGDLNPRAKLSQAQVKAIRTSSGSAKQLAATYGVNIRTIYKIRSRERWN